MPKTAAFTPIKPALERKSARKRTKKEKKRFVFVFVFLVVLVVVVDEPIVVVVVVVFSKGVRRVVLPVVRCIRMTIETSKVSARAS
jgi:hypothetical protein